MKRLALTILLIVALAAPAPAYILAGVLSSYHAPTAPNAPTGVSATAGNGQNTVSWTASAVDGSHDAATSYNLLWGTSAGSEPNTITGVTSGYIHGSLSAGTTYYYKVQGANSAGTGANSSEVSATPLVGFTDTFTASNGTAPDSTYWPTIQNYADGTLYAGSTGLTIQSNKLNYHSRLSTATDNEIEMFASSIPFANGRLAQVDFNTAVATNDDNMETQQLFICGQSYAPNGNGFATKNMLIAYINRASGNQVLNLYSVDNSAALSTLYSAAQGSSALGTVKMVLTDSTHVQLFVGGSSVGTFAHTATIGTSITPGLHVTTTQTSQFTDLNFDNFIAQ